jgi:hypothetical protein
MHLPKDGVWWLPSVLQQLVNFQAVDLLIQVEQRLRSLQESIPFKATIEIQYEEAYGSASPEQSIGFFLIMIQELFIRQASKFSSRNLAWKWRILVEIGLGRHLEPEI